MSFMESGNNLVRYSVVLFKAYKRTIKATEEPKDVKYGYSFCPCVSSMIRRIPLAVQMIMVPGLEVIKLPKKALNKWGDEVDVSGFMPGVFQYNDIVTDVILHSRIGGIPEGAFRGCKNLKRITIPKRVKKIGHDVFAGCDSLEDVYYEGTMEEWEKIEIYTGKRVVELGKQVSGTPVCEVEKDCFEHDPGNDALLKATIHFQCEL